MNKKAKETLAGVFGHMTHVSGDLWQRTIDLQFLGRRCRLPLYADLPKSNPHPDDQQTAAYDLFARDTVGIIQLAESAIRDHCDKLRNRTDRFSDAPIGQLIELEALSFPYRYRSPTLGFLFRSGLDEEHGLAVKIEAGIVVEVGPQDILL
jgi:hypothetical protein